MRISAILGPLTRSSRLVIASSEPSGENDSGT
jgi:hypothetical protein